MKLTQDELRTHYEKGETVILAHRKSYQIKWSKCVNAFTYSWEGMPRKITGLPFTKRGRYHVFTPEKAERIIYN